MNQFLDQKVIGLRVINVAHALGLGRDKAGLAVKINIAGDGKRPCAHFSCFFHGIIKQFLSVALPFVFWCNADGAEGHDRHLSSIITVNF